MEKIFFPRKCHLLKPYLLDRETYCLFCVFSTCGFPAEEQWLCWQA